VCWQVGQAKRHLKSIKRECVSTVVAQQAARVMLQLQASLMYGLVDEGLVVPQDSESFFNLLKADMDSLDQARLSDFK
jgi:hypothetical protein